MLRRVMRKVKAIFNKRRKSSDESDSPLAYPRLNSLYTRLRNEEGRRIRGSYTWAMIHAVHLSSALEVKRISAIEFGVAGGNGLLALERVAIRLQDFYDVQIDVYGFDSGRGLPKPNDYRDLPNLWSEGAYPMEKDTLQKRLTNAKLVIGLVKETLPAFIESHPAPIGFISFDLDQYHSTKQAFQILETSQELLMPRIHCYFDDILGFTYGHHNGERLAIKEFNAMHDTKRQISQIYGLRYYLPQEVAHVAWAEKMYLAHILDHNLYNEFDGFVHDARMDLNPREG